MVLVGRSVCAVTRVRCVRREGATAWCVGCMQPHTATFETRELLFLALLLLRAGGLVGAFPLFWFFRILIAVLDS